MAWMQLFSRGRGAFQVVHPMMQSPRRLVYSAGLDDTTDSLGDLTKEVEMLISDLPENHKTTSSGTGWRSIEWDNVNVAPRMKLSSDICNVSAKREFQPSTKTPSPVETILVKGRRVYLKRDDLLRLERSGVIGNKARKLYALNAIPPSNFPACVVSYGGPQSNAMLALAAVVHSKNGAGFAATHIRDDDGIANPVKMPSPETSFDPGRKRFIYYTKTLPRFLRQQPSGNLFRAKSLGMELVELKPKDYHDLFRTESGGRPKPPAGLTPPVVGDSLWVRSIVETLRLFVFQQ